MIRPQKNAYASILVVTITALLCQAGAAEAQQAQPPSKAKATAPAPTTTKAAAAKTQPKTPKATSPKATPPKVTPPKANVQAAKRAKAARNMWVQRARARNQNYGPLRVIKKIVIDPGHGGGNEGALSHSNHREKDEVLRVAYAVREYLNAKHPEVKVILTRTMDVDLSLTERLEVAHTEEADLFISLHMNASTNTEAEGFEVFFLRADKSMPLVTWGKGTWGHNIDVPESDETMPDVERVENVVRPVGEAMPLLLADLERSRSHYDSGLFAGYLVDQMKTAFRGRRNRGVRQENFGVLRGAMVPAVVVELGFISNPAEDKWLHDSTSHKGFAVALSQALERLDKAHLSRKYQDSSK